MPIEHNATAVSLGTVELQQIVAGTQLVFPVDLSLSLTTSPEGVSLDLDAAVGLGPLQANFNAIARSLPIENDMSGYGTKYYVTVESAGLESAGDSAVLKANINVDAWQIEKGVPGGGFTIRWETRCVSLGPLGKVCTDVPVKVEVPPGPDIKVKLFTEGVACEVSMSLATPDASTIEIRPGAAKAVPRSDIGKFLNDVLGLFNTNLSAMAQKEISEVVNDGSLRQALPKEIAAYNPVIQSVQFETRADGTLGVRVGFRARLTPEQLTEWIKKSLGVAA